MGYADNATYKDQYPYFGRRNPYLKTGEMPSLKVEDDINDTIKENSERANVEIEGGEIVLQPDLSALFKAKGKKHKGGGMDVYLKPDSFVFSDDKTLAVREKELETFELKGAKKWRKNTPAQVLKKNIDIEHYNTLVSNLDNPNKDDLTKKSSAMMLEKYIETLGNVAYLQENKKDFPDGLPAFSQGTAPVYAPGMKENIDEQKQYARYGGTIGNPYKMQDGGRPKTIVVTGRNGKRRIIDLSRKMGNLYLDDVHNGYDEASIARMLQNYKSGDVLELGQDQSGYFPAPAKVVDNGFGRYLANQMDKDPFGYHPVSAPALDNITVTATRKKSQNPFAPVDPERRAARAADREPAEDVFTPLDPGRTQARASAPAGVSQTGYKVPAGTPGQDRYMGKYPPYPSKWTNYFDRKQNFQFEAPDWISPEQFYNTPGVLDYMKGLDKVDGVDNDLHKPDDAQWGWRHQAAFNRFFGKLPIPRGGEDVPVPNIPDPAKPSGSSTPASSTPNITPNGVNVTPQGRKNIDIDFTPWQRVSQGWNALNYATLKRYMPMRSHLNGTDIDPALLNPEQAVADMRTGFNSQLDSLGSLNPILRNAQAASSYGQYLQQAPGVRSQYDNQNAAIKNQFRMFNTQRRDDRNVRNMINDATYQMQSVEGQKHFDDARTFAANNWMNNILRDVETNQTLAYNLATQNNPAYGFDFRHGNWYRNPKSVLDVNTDTKSDFYTNMAQTLMQKIQSGKELSKPEVDFFKALSIGKIPFTPGIKKKGGYTKGNPYR